MDRNFFYIVILLLVVFISGCNNVEEDYEIVGNSVLIDTIDIYYNVTPHTLSSSGCKDMEFESKAYSGDVDVCYGFNTDEIKPTSIQINQPRTVNETVSYTCNSKFTYTSNPKHFLCYKEYQNNQTLEWKNETIFENWFDSIDVLTKTVYWHINDTTEWQN